jgi:hypothetical protein
MLAAAVNPACVRRITETAGKLRDPVPRTKVQRVHSVGYPMQIPEYPGEEMIEEDNRIESWFRDGICELTCCCVLLEPFIGRLQLS